MPELTPHSMPGERFVVRVANAGDVDAFHALVIEADGALERHAESIDASRATIARSLRSLAGEASDAERSYLLLLENTARGEVAGCVQLVCSIGLDQPFYDYRLGKIVHSSSRLKSWRCHDVLYLCNDLTGCSELHSLYVRRDTRGQGGAALLTKAAQLFIATRPAEFAPRTIIEMHGVRDPDDTSPFWEAVGRHFFKVDQRGAERLVAQGRKAFIAELMPKHPVYLSLLPDNAQATVGGIHPVVAGLVPLLEQDGFHFENHVDIFDAGMVLEAHTRTLNGVANSRELVVEAGEATAGAQSWWLAGGEGEGFRVAAGAGALAGECLSLPSEALRRLGMTAGGKVRALAATAA
ncbi:arginine N-succinyltransferase [Aromatoleum toluclasticum]|uniref:arginine N-succinyltransferase n=1 Tax=Aromatoleum toluclasticum TaxID=92003 RepID=UPI001E656249|nr:arginine N-succinyltransferase [Aromatoleum toluclasticum]